VIDYSQKRCGLGPSRAVALQQELLKGKHKAVGPNKIEIV